MFIHSYTDLTLLSLTSCDLPQQSGGFKKSRTSMTRSWSLTACGLWVTKLGKWTLFVLIIWEFMSDTIFCLWLCRTWMNLSLSSLVRLEKNVLVIHFLKTLLTCQVKHTFFASFSSFLLHSVIRNHTKSLSWSLRDIFLLKWPSRSRLNVLQLNSDTVRYTCLSLTWFSSVSSVNRLLLCLVSVCALLL